jgi:hypothetical protein
MAVSQLKYSTGRGVSDSAPAKGEAGYPDGKQHDGSSECGNRQGGPGRLNGILRVRIARCIIRVCDKMLSTNQHALEQTLFLRNTSSQYEKQHTLAKVA